MHRWITDRRETPFRTNQGSGVHRSSFSIIGSAIDRALQARPVDIIGPFRDRPVEGPVDAPLPPGSWVDRQVHLPEERRIARVGTETAQERVVVDVVHSTVVLCTGLLQHCEGLLPIAPPGENLCE